MSDLDKRPGDIYWYDGTKSGLDDLLRRVEILEAINRGRVLARTVLNPSPLDWYLSQLGDA